MRGAEPERHRLGPVRLRRPIARGQERTTPDAPLPRPRYSAFVARRLVRRHGRVPTAKADAYYEYIRQTGLADYAATPGNRGVLVFRRTEGDVTPFVLTTFWDGIDAMRLEREPEARTDRLCKKLPSRRARSKYVRVGLIPALDDFFDL